MIPCVYYRDFTSSLSVSQDFLSLRRHTSESISLGGGIQKGLIEEWRYIRKRGGKYHPTGWCHRLNGRRKRRKEQKAPEFQHSPFCFLTHQDVKNPSHTVPTQPSTRISYTFLNNEPRLLFLFLNCSCQVLCYNSKESNQYSYCHNFILFLRGLFMCMYCVTACLCSCVQCLRRP